MRGAVLSLWVSLALCCWVLGWAGGVEGQNTACVQTQVRQAGPVAHGREVEEDREVVMMDDPGVEVEESKPKKKKSPEEVEAGKRWLLQFFFFFFFCPLSLLDCIFMVGHQPAIPVTTSWEQTYQRLGPVFPLLRLAHKHAWRP